VVADADGVCVIPADLLEDVLSKSMARTERENAIRAELQHGVTTVAALDLTKLAEEALETL
jgi:regulator of RNase E activity RraA